MNLVFVLCSIVLVIVKRNISKNVRIRVLMLGEDRVELIDHFPDLLLQARWQWLEQCPFEV